MVLLPSEKARLVLGYLSEQECYQAYKEFLISSPHLRELRGMVRQGIQPHQYDWKMMGLSNILDEYSSIECLVCALHINLGNLKQMQECNTVLKKVQMLIDFVKDFEDCSSPDNRTRESSSTQSQNTSKEPPKSPQRNSLKKRQKNNTKPLNTIKKQNSFTRNEMPSIDDIPESHHSDESSDVISISELSPFKSADRTVIKNDTEKKTPTINSDEAGQMARPQSLDDLYKDTPEQKKKTDKTNTSNLENILNGLDISLYSEVLLERTDIHEIIAENINKICSSEFNNTVQDNNIKNVNTPNKSQDSSVCDKLINSTPIPDLQAHLDHVVKNIMSATENEDVFHEILDDIVTVKVAHGTPMSTTSSEDASPVRPTTSTPEHASKKHDVLDTSTSPVEKSENSPFNRLKSDRENIQSESIHEDSIKHRLRNRTKTSQNSDKSVEIILEPMEVDKNTPQKSNLDLLAMAINNADVSGSLRKLNTNINDNKIVILSNEAVTRNITDYTCLSGINFVSDNKSDNAGQNTETVHNTMPLNTHFILPSSVNNNVFLNAQLPQYLISNTDSDQNRMFLIGGAPINVPSQNNMINNESSDIVTMPTFIMLPSTSAGAAAAVNENPSTQTIRKPRAVILPQREIKRCHRKIVPNIKTYSDLLMISEQTEETSGSSNTQSKEKNLEESNIINLVINSNKFESKSVPKPDISIPQSSKKESKPEIITRKDLKISDSNIKLLEKARDVSSTKTIEKMERETPELATVQIHKRQSLSTPRRTKSHVRVLDFNTPPKMNCIRKATTSPKLGSMRINPKTLEKLKSSRSLTAKDPIKSVLFRSPKRKIIYLSDNSDQSTLSNGKSKGMIFTKSKSDKVNTSKPENVDHNLEKNKMALSEAITGNNEVEDKLPHAAKENNSTNIADGVVKKSNKKVNADVLANNKSKIIVHPKRGEKFDFKPTAGKNRKSIITTNRSKSGWDSDLRALVSPIKYPVKKRNIKRKTKPARVNNKSDLSENSVDNMEMHAKKIEDALNFSFTNNTSSESVIDTKKSITNTELKKPEDSNSTEEKLVQASENTSPKKNIIVEQESKEILKPVAMEKRVRKKCNNNIILSTCMKNVLTKPPKILNEDLIICESESSIDAPSLVIIDSNSETCINKQDSISNIQVEKQEISTENEISKQKQQANVQNCNRTVLTKPSIVDNKINISEQNFSLLETPFKCDGNMVPKTPRFICTEDTPLVKIKRDNESNSLAKCGIPTPSFPLTPKLLSASTPEIKLVEAEECASNVKKPSDNSGPSSYYKPDESENINILDRGNNSDKKDLELSEIKECKENLLKENNKILENDVDTNVINENSNISCNTSSSSDSNSDSSTTSSSNTSSSSDDTITPVKKTPEKKLPELFNTLSTKVETTVTNSTKIDSSESTSKTNTGPSIDCRASTSLMTFKNLFKQDKKSENKTTLAHELNEKRQRILNKVRADLKVNVTKKNISKNKGAENSTFNRKKVQSKAASTLPVKSNSKVIEPTSDEFKKLSTKAEKEDVLPFIKTKNNRKSESPKKRVLESKLESTNTLSKSDGSISLNTMTIMHSIVTKSDDKFDNNPYPLLHISDDESDQSFNLGTDQPSSLIDDSQEKNPTAIVAEKNTIECKLDNKPIETPLSETANVSLDKIMEDSSKQQINTSLDKTTKELSNHEIITSPNKTTTELSKEPISVSSKSSKTTDNISSNGKMIELLKQSPMRSNEEQTSKDLLKSSDINLSGESIESVESNFTKDTEKTENVTLNNDIVIEMKSASMDNMETENSNDNVVPLEFTIHETLIEYCYESEDICTGNKQKINNDDGFDVNSFKVNISEEGVLKISPLVEFVNISPKPEKSESQADDKSARKDISTKKRVKKSPLNVLYDELDEPVVVHAKQTENKEVEDISTRTPCANLYHDSPQFKYQKTKKNSKAISQKLHEKGKKSSKMKKSHKSEQHKSKTGVPKKFDCEERSNAASTSSAKVEKVRKRKREGDDDIFGKKLKPCNPQELLKNVGLDTLLNVIHGPE